MEALESKNIFKSIYDKYIKRDGSKELMAWLESDKCDFFTAPASAKYHLAVKGGLCEHSINVYNNLKWIVEKEKTLHPESVTNITEESMAICALLHDLCKVNFYKISERNVKNESGNWVKEPYYTIDEEFPMGHGEKSLYIIGSFMKLTRDEAAAINWHMGAFDKRAMGGDHSISDAYEKYPLAVYLQMADFVSSYIDETRE